MKEITSLQDIFDMDHEVIEHDPTKRYILKFKHELTQCQYVRIRKLLDEHITDFGKFLILGHEVEVWATPEYPLFYVCPSTIPNSYF
jgi:hypothetical protein